MQIKYVDLAAYECNSCTIHWIEIENDIDIVVVIIILSENEILDKQTLRIIHWNSSESESEPLALPSPRRAGFRVLTFSLENKRYLLKFGIFLSTGASTCNIVRMLSEPHDPTKVGKSCKFVPPYPLENRFLRTDKDNMS